jgi:hypothetical protein
VVAVVWVLHRADLPYLVALEFYKHIIGTAPKVRADYTIQSPIIVDRNCYACYALHNSFLLLELVESSHHFG